jgi:hypothetical protein
MLHHSGHDRPVGICCKHADPLPTVRTRSLVGGVLHRGIPLRALLRRRARRDTYADRVRSCPECGVFLLGHALDPPELTAKLREQRVVVSRSPRSH